MKENRKLLREVLKDIRHDMTDEEVLNLLADSKISENLAGENEKYTLGQRAADAIAKFAGRWVFIFAFTENFYCKCSCKWNPESEVTEDGNGTDRV